MAFCQSLPYYFWKLKYLKIIMEKVQWQLAKGGTNPKQRILDLWLALNDRNLNSDMSIIYIFLPAVQSITIKV